MKKSILIWSMMAATHAASVSAAGFALAEQSGSGLGNAYAGAAAVAEDASTIFSNPAGMTYLQGTQFTGALHAIKPTAQFHDAQSQAAAGGRPLGGEGGDLGSWAFLPNLYYKQDINDSLKWGIGISTPFGLKTEYDKAWLGRFQGIKSELKTININPSLAWRVNDKLSLGAGLSAMWAHAELTSAVNLGGLGESSVRNRGSDWGFGFNLGSLYQLTPDTRIGLAYRSKVTQHLRGEASSPFTGVNADPNRTLNTDISAKLTLPETLSISSFSQLDSHWDLLTDITWTRWSRFRELRILRENGSGSTLGLTPEYWNDVLRYSAALNYHYSPTVKLRGGLAYDHEAIDHEYRTVRIPGNDRTWLALGASWQYSAATKLDIGYAHMFIRDAKINDNQASTGRGVVNGEFRGDANILSLQLSHQF